MPIVFYEIDVSPPCRAVVMTARQLGIELEHKRVDITTGEHLKPEFLKINPQHTVPTIDDNGFILWESRVIMTYLVNTYAKGNLLYPIEPQKRANVDRVLNFDLGTLASALMSIVKQLFMEGRTADPVYHEALKKALKLLDEMLERTPYAAGDHMTLADISIIATLSLAEALDMKLDEYPKVLAWMTKVKQEISGYDEINEKPQQILKEHLSAKILGK